MRRRGLFQTYATCHRGVELLVGAFNWLDLVPKGRNEEAGHELGALA